MKETMKTYTLMLLTNNSDLENCYYRTQKFIFSSSYGGIPETLILNIVGWLLLLMLFSVLRKHAWNCDRMTLMQCSDKWTQLFYGATCDEAIVTRQERPDRDNDSSNMDDPFRNHDMPMFAWIGDLIRLSDEKIIVKRGKDALHYISFQKRLILLTAIITCTSLGVVLPVNMQGNLQGNITNYAHTTISNLPSSSNWLWVHLILSFLYVPLVIYIMNGSSGYQAKARANTNCIMVTNISHAHRNAREILNYFQLMYPQHEFKSAEIAYDVSKLTKLCDEYATVTNAKAQCERKLRNTQKRVKLSEYGFYLCLQCCRTTTRDALEYYESREQALMQQIEHERAYAQSTPLGIAFVCVRNREACEHIIKNFKPGTCRAWFLTYAPEPSDIHWQNLSVNTRFWYLKAITINVMLFVVLFFLTTPFYVVGYIYSFQLNLKIIEQVNPLLSEFLPTLLLWTFTALMPFVVAYSDEWLPHWTRSRRNNAIMTKTFFYLLLMALILPSLGLTSAEAFIRWWITSTTNETYRWECVFLPDKGALFVNYIITSSLIGSALELIRFPELFLYAWAVLIAKSPAEYNMIKYKSILREFPFGIHYAWSLVLFTIVLVYSLICPLIAPFGLLYICLKHLVDRYSLYYTYGSSHMTERIHVTAVQLVRFSLFVLLALMTAYTALRSGLDIMVVMMLCALLILNSYLFTFKVKPTCYRDDQRRPEPEVTRELVYQSPALGTLCLFNNHKRYGTSSGELYDPSVTLHA